MNLREFLKTGKRVRNPWSSVMNATGRSTITSAPRSPKMARWCSRAFLIKSHLSRFSSIQEFKTWLAERGIETGWNAY